MRWDRTWTRSGGYSVNETDFDPARLLPLMEQWSELLIRTPAPVRQQLDAACRAYEHGHLVMAGGEGVGKSTLINAMLGTDVAPTSKYHAGTVAPIYFLHATWHSPQYRVVHQTSEGELLTTKVDQVEFKQWLLQKNNPDNMRGVVRGEVMLDHPLLRDGLRLVDMPGTGGRSSAIADETYAYLSGTALTAVLVNLGSRPMDELVKVCNELQKNQRDVSVAALVVNEHDQDDLASEALYTHLVS
jgi:Dynamin family